MLSFDIANRRFLVIKTCDENWWSFDKRSTGIYLQRGETKNAVLKFLMKKERKTPLRCIQVYNRGAKHRSLYDAVEIIIGNKIEVKEYDLLCNNFKHFSIFSKEVVSKSQETSWVPDIGDQWVLYAILVKKLYNLWGGSWNPALAYDSSAGSPDAHTRKEYTNNEILTLLKEELDKSSCSSTGQIRIEKVFIYKTPLEALTSCSPRLVKNFLPPGRQLTSIDFHAFVMFNTSDGFWWSLEKNQNGIFLGRNRNKDNVKNKLQGVPRKTPIDLIIEDDGFRSLTGLLSLVVEREFVNKSYSGIFDSCQHFARTIFDKTSKSKSWDFTTPVEYTNPFTLISKGCKGLYTYKGHVVVVVVAVLTYLLL